MYMKIRKHNHIPFRPAVKTNCINTIPITPREVKRQLKTAKVKAGLLRLSTDVNRVHPSVGCSKAFIPTHASIPRMLIFKKVHADVTATEKTHDKEMKPKDAHLYF